MNKRFAGILLVVGTVCSVLTPREAEAGALEVATLVFLPGLVGGIAGYSAQYVPPVAFNVARVLSDPGKKLPDLVLKKIASDEHLKQVKGAIKSGNEILNEGSKSSADCNKAADAIENQLKTHVELLYSQGIPLAAGWFDFMKKDDKTEGRKRLAETVKSAEWLLSWFELLGTPAVAVLGRVLFSPAKRLFYEGGIHLCAVSIHLYGAASEAVKKAQAAKDEAPEARLKRVKELYVSIFKILAPVAALYAAAKGKHMLRAFQDALSKAPSVSFLKDDTVVIPWVAGAAVDAVCGGLGSVSKDLEANSSFKKGLKTALWAHQAAQTYNLW